MFNVTNADGIRKPDGTFFRVGDPISTIQSQNEAGGALPLNSHIASPRIRQPYSDQYSVGWSHQLDAATVIDVDYMHTEGRDLGWRIQLNQRNPASARPARGSSPIWRSARRTSRSTSATARAGTTASTSASAAG